MSHGKSNIKKFGEFMQPKKKWKMLNRLFIKGKIKGGFLRGDQDFEMQIFFTGVKRLIVDIQSSIDIKNPKLKIDFKIGDNVDKAREWVKLNNHIIYHEINRY